MTEDAPSRNLAKFVVRLPEGMRDRIAKAAEANGRSMNAEIVKRLEDSFPTTEQMLIAARVEELARISVLRQDQERLFFDLLKAEDPRWELEYREYARLHAIERSLESEIEAYTHLSEEIEVEAMEEIERIREEEADKHRRDYTVTAKGAEMLGKKSA